MKNITTIKTTVQHVEIKLDRQELLRLLNEALQFEGEQIPNNADIFIRVPGGADWSNTNLDVDKDTPLHISWTTTKQE